MIRARSVLTLFSSLAALAATDAHGQRCNINGSSMSFGTISEGGNTSATTILRADCNMNTSHPWMLLCISIDEPVAPFDVRNRNMLGPSPARLAYNFYSDPAYTQIWGSISGSVPPPALLLPLTGGNVHTNVTLYGRVPAGQGALPGGNYEAIFPTSAFKFGFQSYTISPPNCANVPIDSSVTFQNFRVTANVSNSCSVSATPVDFGSRGKLDAEATTTGTITVRCGSGIAYRLALNAGTSVGATMNNRLMTRGGGSETLRYNLFTSPSHASIWGDGGSGTLFVSGTGSGGDQRFSVYGRIPAQSPTPNPGSYSDMITVTMTY